MHVSTEIRPVFRDGLPAADKTARFLVIEDDPIHSRVLTRSLRARGFEVAFAGNAGDGLAIATDWQPNCIVTELKVAGASMLPAIRPLRERSPQARICIVTHLAGIATAVEAVKLGAWYYLAKPATTDEILLRLGVVTTVEEGRGAADERDANDPSLARCTYALDDIEWRHILHALRECHGNIAEAARRLRMHRRTLHRKLSAHGQEAVGSLLARMREGRKVRHVPVPGAAQALSASIEHKAAVDEAPVLLAA